MGKKRYFPLKIKQMASSESIPYYLSLNILKGMDDLKRKPSIIKKDNLFPNINYLICYLLTK